MKLVSAAAVAVVLLAMAVQSAEVQMLDEIPVARPSKAEDAEKLRAKIFEGDVDSDEAMLDNGDDSDLLQESAGTVGPKMPKKKGGGKGGKKKGPLNKPPMQDPKS